MSKTGESYTTARRHIIRQAGIDIDSGPTRWHLPGSIPATTALRILLTAAGVQDPRTHKPLTEALLYGICGGIGAGATSFYYAKEDFSSFYIAGRHCWHDDLQYLEGAFARFGIKPNVRETAGAKGAERQLRDALADERPCIAWVDMANLPHRGMPAQYSGMMYHVISVYQIDDSSQSALIGDMTDTPVRIGLEQLAVARGRIKQFKNRLLSIPSAGDKFDLAALIRSGLEACVSGLKKAKGGKGAAAMSGLEAIGKWVANLQPSSSKESWTQTFPRGHRLWQGLTSIYEFIENYHTGGGLGRPLFAECLAEASEIPGLQGLTDLSKRYAQIGSHWSELALAAIPQDVPVFRQVRELSERRVELRTGGEQESYDGIRAVWAELMDLQKKSRSNFPLSESQCTELLESLHAKAAALYEAEIEARESLDRFLKN
jgi:hypothetical protein